MDHHAKISVKYQAAMPTNLDGPGDTYHPENSHVIPALICKFHAAKVRGDATVTVRGTGTPRREFLYNEDMGDDVTIRELAVTVGRVPDGTMHKLMDASRLSGYGWTPAISLRAGFAVAYDQFRKARGHASTA